MQQEIREISGRRSGAAIDPPGVLQELLARADVRINGDRPWDIRVRDPQVYSRILSTWSLGFGEAYMDGQWDCECLDEMFFRLLSADLQYAAAGLSRFRLLAESLRHRLFNLQSKSRAFTVARRHYDIGNDVFTAMLDERMMYSCAYWGSAQSLEQAQVDKLDMICRKLQLRAGDSLLDIGCGWGGLAQFAAERYGVEVTGVTVSKEQMQIAQQRCAGLPVKLLLQDYRDVQGTFDKIVSVGMFEHVGLKNYTGYFEAAKRLLAPNGLFLLHTIGVAETCDTVDPWIDRYIFPNGKLPSAVQIASAVEGRFIIEDWHNFGADYDRTLMAWWDKLRHAWPTLSKSYDQRFFRMWKYYLLSCAGLFRSRQGQLWQIVLTHPERGEPYRSTR